MHWFEIVLPILVGQAINIAYNHYHSKRDRKLQEMQVGYLKRMAEINDPKG